LADEFEDWAEPKNRLATVLYLRNELDEAVRLCERVRLSRRRRRRRRRSALKSLT